MEFVHAMINLMNDQKSVSNEQLKMGFDFFNTNVDPNYPDCYKILNAMILQPEMANDDG